MTTRALPRGMLDDGHTLPSFDAAALEDLSSAPIGKGCQAEVFSCTVPSTGRRCALKVLKKTLATRDAERQAFVREAHLLLRARHEHVLEALGCSETADARPCLLLARLPPAVDVSSSSSSSVTGGRPILFT